MRRISGIETHISSKLLSHKHPHTSGRADVLTGLGSVLVPISVICADTLSVLPTYSGNKTPTIPLNYGSQWPNKSSILTLLLPLFHVQIWICSVHHSVKPQSKTSVTMTWTCPAYCSVLQPEWLSRSCGFGPRSQDTQLVYWTEIWQHIMAPGEKVWQDKGVKTNLVPVPGVSVRLLSSILLSSCLFSKHKELLATRCQPNWNS